MLFQAKVAPPLENTMFSKVIRSRGPLLARAAMSSPSAARLAVCTKRVGPICEGKRPRMQLARQFATSTTTKQDSLGECILRAMSAKPDWEDTAMFVFDQIDTDAKGIIDASHLSRVVGAGAKEVLAALDVNRDGGDLTRAKFMHFLYKLDYLQRRELLNDMSLSMLGDWVDKSVAVRILQAVNAQPRWQATAEQAFDTIDGSGSGTLSVEDFTKIVGNEHARAAVQAMDVNRDGGRVTRAKFMNLLWHLDDFSRLRLLQAMAEKESPRGVAGVPHDLGIRILECMKTSPAWHLKAKTVFDRLRSTKGHTIDAGDVSTIVGPEHADAVVKALDVNRDGGGVTQAKFLHFLWQLEGTQRLHLLKDIIDRMSFQQEVATQIILALSFKPGWMVAADEVFNHLDVDNQGTLDTKKLARVVGEKHAADVLKVLDVNQDGGQVTRAKFMNLVWRLDNSSRIRLLDAMRRSDGNSDASEALGRIIVEIMHRTPEWMQDAMAAFDSIDYKRAGVLDVDAMSNVVGRKYGTTVMKALDINRDGGDVTRAKFLNFFWQVDDEQRKALLAKISDSIAHQHENAASILRVMQEHRPWIERAEHIFNQIDADGSGTLEVCEFEKIVGETHASAVVEAMDVNRDGGSVTRAKFMNLLWHVDDTSRIQLLDVMQEALD